jgi:hypothetical protein
VSLSTYLEMTTDTAHFAQKPSANGASAVALLPYWYWRKETAHALWWENNKWHDPEVFHCLHHSTCDSVIFITNMTFKPHNKRHFLKLLYLPQQSQRATVWPERVRWGPHLCKLADYGHSSSGLQWTRSISRPATQEHCANLIYTRNCLLDTIRKPFNWLSLKK